MISPFTGGNVTKKYKFETFTFRNEKFKSPKDYYEEGGEVEQFFMMILEEYSSSMGLAKQFKETMKQQQN